MLPGLGFDCRIFRRLKLHDYKLIALDWMEPTADESLGSYTNRIAGRINFSDRPVVLIGHSFGGIVAQEIAARHNVAQVILISSIRSREEMPSFFKMLAPLHAHRWFSRRLVNSTFPLWAAKHGYIKAEERDLFLDMVNKNSDLYLQWALKHLSQWKGVEQVHSAQICQIHGEHDKTFPPPLLKSADEIIGKGGHFMIYQKPNEVSQAILKCIVY